MGNALFLGQKTDEDIINPDQWFAASVDDLKQARKSLNKAPISALPILAASIVAERSGDQNDAFELAALATSRSPQNLSALLWLTELTLAKKDFESSVLVIEQLLETNPVNADYYMALLADLLEEQDGIDAVMGLLGRRGDIVTSLIPIMEERNFTRESISAVAYFGPINEHATQLRNLIQEGSIEEAFQIWISLISEDQLNNLQWPIDPTFTRRSFYPPFEWGLHQAHTELEERGGLFVKYPGKGNPILAEQLLPLSPGKYKFDAKMSLNSDGAGGYLLWRIDCYKTKAALVSKAVTQLNDQEKSISQEFIVPKDECAFQRLFLQGKQGSYLKHVRANIKEVSIQVIELFDDSI